jgi:hypothetical protein
MRCLLWRRMYTARRQVIGAQTILSHLRTISIMKVHCLFDAVSYYAQASRREDIFVEKQGENRYAFRRNGIYTAHRQVIVITFPALRYYSSPPSLGHAQNLAVRAINTRNSVPPERLR